MRFEKQYLAAFISRLSQATWSVVSTWVGDRLGTPRDDFYFSTFRLHVTTNIKPLHWLFLYLWSHQAKPTAWVYVIYCESVQSARCYYGTYCTLSQ